MRICYKCKIQKELVCFYKHNKTGHRYECIDCVKLAAKAYRQKYPEKATASWRRANNRYYKANSLRVRGYDLKRTYGITLEQYNAMLEQQGHVCAICKQKETGKINDVVKSLAVDHCHSTGKIRGLLCSNCNQGIGKLKDNVGIMTNAISYLLGDL